jgi:hypothetical protein
MGQPFRRQRDHHLVDSGQPPLPLSNDSRLERGVTVAGHRYFHRPGTGEHRLGTVAVAGILAVTASRVILRIAQVIVQLTFQRTLNHHFGQFPQQTALASQLQPVGAGPLCQLAQQLLIGCREPSAALTLLVRHICHWCLLVSQELHR